MNDDDGAEIKKLEEARGRALVNSDWAALEALLADDLVHIHANGQIENKSEYLTSVRTKLEFLKFERPSLRVRSYGNWAVATGEFLQTVRVKGPGTVVELRAASTQTWVKTNGRWLQNSFQATRIG